MVDHGLYTLKFHLLDHLVLDLGRYTSLDFLDAGPYEYYNTRIKQAYRLGSRRKATALEETVQNIQQGTQSSLSGIKKAKTSTTTSVQSLVREGFTSTTRELKALYMGNVSNFNSQLRKELFASINPSDVQVFHDILHEELVRNKVTVVDENIIITVVKSGFIDSYRIPTLDDYDETKNKVRFNQTIPEEMSRKRVFATSSFGPT